jgi:hypothetical protein
VLVLCALDARHAGARVAFQRATVLDDELAMAASYSCSKAIANAKAVRHSYKRPLT